MEEYTLEIKRGHSEISDYCTDVIKTKIEGSFLDVGCNGGMLIEEMGYGQGCDASETLIKKCREKNIVACVARAEALPFADGSFDTVVLNSVLEQVEDWKTALNEAVRVARVKVIGINPLPYESQGSASLSVHASGN